MLAKTERERKQPRIEAQIGIGFTGAQLDWLDRQAEARAMSIAAIVREALAAHMARTSRRAA